MKLLYENNLIKLTIPAGFKYWKCVFSLCTRGPESRRGRGIRGGRGGRGGGRGQ